MELEIDLKAIQEDVVNGYYDILDDVELDENIKIDMKLELDRVLIWIVDYDGGLEGGFAVGKEVILNMKEQKELDSLINQIYYYNCNKEIY